MLPEPLTASDWPFSQNQISSPFGAEAFVHILQILLIRFRKWELKIFLNPFFNHSLVISPYAIRHRFCERGLPACSRQGNFASARLRADPLLKFRVVVWYKFYQCRGL